MNINYIGEHLIYGQLGNLFISLGLVASILALVSYLISALGRSENDTWKVLGRASFTVHSFSILAVIGLMFFLMIKGYFEYHYVWQHTSRQLPFRYLFASFWEGQEGSFLLWSFWNMVLSWFIIRKRDSWEAPVMGVMSLIQVFLGTMILGIFLGSYKLGTNPFVLLRLHPDMVSLPFVQLPDYLERIGDGRGLNPLLQNYWMTIHPPTLFLGFAGTAIPFAFAIGGLITNRLKEWVSPAIPWAFFAVMVLGTGILMGGAWAYEALSFGGFWAWDPVENASLVPWITLVAAAHLMILHKNRKQFLVMTYVLTLITFILVLYSTFLTRSGILGDSSVHSFTDLGMSGHLLSFLLFFLLLSIVLLIFRWKKIPQQKEEEHIWSREFWVFMGTLTLIISSFQITFTTSIPVFNKLFSTKLAPPVDAIAHFNAWQIPVAIVICLLIGVGQFFKYRNSDVKQVLLKLLPSFSISLIISIVIIWQVGMMHINQVALLFTSVFAILANTDYFIRIVKGNITVSGGSISHIGIGLILLGSLIANSKSQVISQNRSGINLGEDFPNAENILLRIGDTLAMGEYYVTYTGKEKEGVNIFYNIEYFRINTSSGQLEREFILKPVVQTNPRMGNVSEPSTKRYVSKDIYTHITYADLEAIEEKHEPGEYKPAVTKTMATGDTIATSSNLIVLSGLNTQIDHIELGLNENDIAVGGKVTIIDISGRQFQAEPLYILKDRMVYSKEAEVEELGLKIGFTRIDPQTGKIDLTVAERNIPENEFIIMKAIVFPYINLLWTGCLVLIFGTILSIRRRIKLK